MSYTFLLDAGEESLAECFSDIPAFVLSRLNPTAVACCSSGSVTASCHDSQSGTTSPHLTQLRGEVESMSSAVGFPVKTFQSLEKERDSTGNAPASGERWQESFAKYDPVSRSWKTRQRSLDGGLVEFSETWPKWGMAVDGESWGQVNAGPGIIESEYGFLPTPTRSDYHGYKCRDKGKRNIRLNHYLFLEGREDLSHSATFREWMMAWPIGWTALRPLGMDKFQQWLLSHGVCSTGE